MTMDPRKRKFFWMLSIFLIVLLHAISPGHGFFFPRFFNRRQVFPAQQPQQHPSSSRGQVVDGYQFPGQGPNLRIINRQNQNTGPVNSNNNGGPDGTVPNPSFHVPKALCLACENFPWTPVAGKEGAASAPVGKHVNPQPEVQQATSFNVQQQKPNPPQQQETTIHAQYQPQQQGYTQNQQQETTIHVQQQPQQGYNQNQQVLDDKFPIHQHLEVTKEPGGTVVINALGPYPQPQGARKPFSFQFDSTQTQNNVQGQSSFSQHSIKPLGSAIILPYDPQTSNPTLLKPVSYPAGQPKAVELFTTSFAFNENTTPLPVDIRPTTYPQPNQNLGQQQNFANHGYPQQQPPQQQPPQQQQQQPQQPQQNFVPDYQQQQSQQQNFVSQDQQKQQQQQRPEQQGYGGYSGQRPIVPAFISNQPPLFYTPREPRPGPPPTLLHPVKNPNNYYVPNNRPNNNPPIYLVNNQNQINHPPPPRPGNHHHAHHQNIPPITVGTIVAAQHNLQIHDIQPAQLVYQEHSHGYAPPHPPPNSGYAPGPVQQKPNYGSPSAPHSFKLPIISRPNNNNIPFGTFTINQIPVNSVPNHVPHHPGQYGGPPPVQQGNYPPGPPINQNFPPKFPPAPHKPRDQYGPPKPNYGPPKQPYEGPQPSQSPSNYGQPRPFESNFEWQQSNQQPQQPVNQPTQQVEVQLGNANFGPPPPPQRPNPPERPFRPQPPQQEVSYGNVPMPHREMLPPPPTYIPPRNPPQQPFSSAPPPSFPPQEETNQYNVPIFENGLDTDDEPEEDVKDEGEGQVSFPTPQATLELGPAPNSEDEPPIYSQGKQPNFEPQPDVHIEVTNEDTARNPSLITIPNLLRIQPNQGYRGVEQVEYYQPQGPSQFQHQYIVPLGQKTTVTFPEYAQASFSSYVRQRQPEISVSESSVNRPVPPPPQPPVPVPGSVPASSSDYDKNPHIQSLESQKNKDEPEVKSPVKVTPRPFEAGPIGAYEIIPATQYDITHLFTNPPPPTVPVYEESAQASVQNQQGIPNRPFPIPVSFSESDAANINIKSPVFVVQQADGQTEYPQPVIHARPSIVHNVNSPVPSQQFFQNSQFQHQTQYDPLPPSIVSALHHAQRTSFLTHQHLTPVGNGDQEKTVYVNSIAVQESPSYNKPGAPFAFDLNSGKPILVHEERDSETQSLKTVLESDSKSEEASPSQENKSFVNYSAQEEPKETAETNSVTKAEVPAPADQTVVNCNNNHQWVFPTEADFNGNREQVLAEAEAAGQQDGRKKFVYYYPSPMSSIYWVEQPQVTDSKQGGFGQRIRVDIQHGAGQGQGGSEQEVQNGFHSEASAPKTIYSKPILKWSKVLAPSGQLNNVVHATRLSHSFLPMQIEGEAGVDESSAASISDPVSTPGPFDIHAQGNTPQIDEQSLDEAGEPEPEVHSTTTTGAPLEGSVVQNPVEQSQSLESDASVVRQQIFRVRINGQEVPVASEDRRSFRPKSPKLEEDSMATVTEVGISSEIVGSTTGAECVTEATTEYTVPTSFVTDTTDGTTNTNYASTPTFSPRVKVSAAAREKIRLRVGSRFPTGRPAIPAYRTSSLSEGSQDVVSPGSASIQVPVYRPSTLGIGMVLREQSLQTSTPTIVFSPRKNLLTLEDIYKSSEMKQLGQFGPATLTTTVQPNVTASTAPAQPDVEDDEAEDSGLGGTTGRKVPAASSSFQVVTDLTQPTTTTESPVSSSSMSTKIVKTVRVRQRMRPGSLGSFLNSNAGNGPLRSRSSGLSRIRVIQRPASQEYFKNFPEYAAPEGETLAEEEQKEVKKALIEIKKI